MFSNNNTIGAIGEQIAACYLKNKGYFIKAKHVTSHWGELDIVAQKGEKIVFIEVKTRVGSEKGRPYEAVNYFKVKHLERAIQHYLLQNNCKKYKLSLDIVSILLNRNHSVEQIKHYENIDMTMYNR
jgi:putative endonuclease